MTLEDIERIKDNKANGQYSLHHLECIELSHELIRAIQACISMNEVEVGENTWMLLHLLDCIQPLALLEAFELGENSASS